MSAETREICWEQVPDSWVAEEYSKILEDTRKYSGAVQEINTTEGPTLEDMLQFAGFANQIGIDLTLFAQGIAAKGMVGQYALQLRELKSMLLKAVERVTEKSREFLEYRRRQGEAKK